MPVMPCIDARSRCEQNNRFWLCSPTDRYLTQGRCEHGHYAIPEADLPSSSGIHNVPSVTGSREPYGVNFFRYSTTARKKSVKFRFCGQSCCGTIRTDHQGAVLFSEKSRMADRAWRYPQAKGEKDRENKLAQRIATKTTFNPVLF